MNKKLIGAVLTTLAFGTVAATTQVVEASCKCDKTHCKEANTATTGGKNTCDGEKTCGGGKACDGEKANDKNTSGEQPAIDKGKPATGGDKACGGGKGCAGMKTDKN